MTTKRTNLLAGTVLGGALLLGTAGLVLAQGPTATPTPSPTTGTPGGMMGAGQGMMGAGQGMMGAGQGMMGAGQMPDMTAMHATMGQDGTFDPELMQSMHEAHHPSR